MRLTANFTQAALAATVGRSLSGISSFENGARLAPEAAVREWAKACGVPVEPLLDKRAEAKDKRTALDASGEGAANPTRRLTFELPSGTKRLYFRLPPQARLFVGRVDEVKQLDRGFKPRGRVRVLAITGLGGVGKSRLAAHYVHERARNYDVVAWIRAQDRGIADLAGLAEQLGEPVANLSVEQRANLALRWLAGCGLRWLLVLDDIPSAAELADCCPRAGHGRVVVTTRDVTGMDECADDTVELKVFDEETAVEYLVDRAGRPGERDDALRVARELGCLPLALSHAATYCATTSFADYFRLLGQVRADIGLGDAVATTWLVSLDVAQERSALASSVMAMAAHLAPSAIPRDLFEVLIDPTDALAEWRLREAFNALRELSLAHVDDTTISVHGLLQRVVCEQMPVGAHNALKALADAFPTDPSLPDTWSACEELIPHVIAYADSVAPPGAAVRDRVPADHEACLFALLHKAWRYLLDAGQRADAVAFAQRSAVIAIELCGEVHPEALTARIRQAESLQWSGHTSKTLQMSADILVDCECALGGEHPVTLDARAQLAFAYQWDRRLEPAITLCEQVLAERSRIIGQSHPDTLSARVHLSWSLGLAGRHKDAIAAIKPALKGHRKLLGADHPTVFNDRASIALFRRELYQHERAQLDEAITSFKSLARDREKLLGDQHPDTLWTWANLARSHELAEDPHKALKILLTQPGVVSLTERVLGAEHQDTLNARCYLASAYRSARRIDEAMKLGEMVVEDLERVVGSEHPDAISARAVLADAYHDSGRLQDAIKLAERVVDERTRILGAQHPDTRAARAKLKEFTTGQ